MVLTGQKKRAKGKGHPATIRRITLQVTAIAGCLVLPKTDATNRSTSVSLLLINSNTNSNDKSNNTSNSNTSNTK